MYAGSAVLLSASSLFISRVICSRDQLFISPVLTSQILRYDTVTLFFTCTLTSKTRVTFL